MTIMASETERLRQTDGQPPCSGSRRTTACHGGQRNLQANAQRRTPNAQRRTSNTELKRTEIRDLKTEIRAQRQKSEFIDQSNRPGRLVPVLMLMLMLVLVLVLSPEMAEVLL